MTFENSLPLIGMFSSAIVWIVAVFNENSEQRMNRSDYIATFIILFFLVAMLGVGLSIALPTVAPFVQLIALLIISYPLAQRSTRRARDAGWEKAPVYCMLIPVIGFVLIFVLFFKPSVGDVTKQRKGTIFDDA